jgi:hypothetical protein
MLDKGPLLKKALIQETAITLAEGLLSKVFKPKVAKELSHFGVLSEFKVDLQGKKVVFVIHLKGEAEPLKGSLKILNFNFKEEGGKIILIVRKVSLDAREWMDVTLQKYWPGEVRFEITDNKYIVKVLKSVGMLS